MYSPNGVGSSRVGYLSLCIGPCAPAPLRPCACHHRHPRAPATIHHTVPITHRHGRATRPRTCTCWYLLATTALALSTCPLDQYHCQNGMPKWRPDISLFYKQAQRRLTTQVMAPPHRRGDPCVKITFRAFSRLLPMVGFQSFFFCKKETNTFLLCLQYINR